MTCFHPVLQYRYHEDGKTKWTTDASKADLGIFAEPVLRPCGRCPGCLLDRSRDTAIRCVCEAQMFEHNCFITLTVAPEYINEVFPGNSLVHRPWQLFAKDFRKKFSGIQGYVHPITGKYESNIRFLMCGEYGSLLDRPHYHACVFNFDFEDKYLWTIRRGVKLYRSPTLEELWPYGFSTIGDVNFQSAAYLARYVVKKCYGEEADEHYFNPETGEIRHPEYIQFPRGFGLGALWFNKYGDGIYTQDKIVLNMGKLVAKPPRYFDNIYDLQNPGELDNIKSERKRRACAHSEDNTFERLQVRERVCLSRLKRLQRGFENDF